MNYPENRGRRLRRTESIRRLTRETNLHVSDLVWPLFVSELVESREPIASMPGCYNMSPKETAVEAARAYELGIPAVLLFGTPAEKTADGALSCAKDGIVQRAVRAIKASVPELAVITDVCLCEYTDHGHCGILSGEQVINDATLKVLARQAVSHAAAGADMVAPSDMMDGRVAAIRRALDDNQFQDTIIMSYAAKYCSAFYGPFREAVNSAPKSGDRKSYQMDPANSREALKEVQMDISEGADIVMVKPALAYLDVIATVRQSTTVPVAAYNVSGEYSMVKLAAEASLVDEKRMVLEILTSIKRAGADIIITYHALDVARWLKE